MTMTMKQGMAESERADITLAITEIAPNAMFAIGVDGRIRFVNPAVERMFGYPPDALIGQNVSCLMPSPYREAHDEYIAAYLRTGQAKVIGGTREVLAVRRNGETFPIELFLGEVRTGQPSQAVRNGAGEDRLFVGIVKDISERQQAETRIRQYTERLQEANRDLEVSNVKLETARKVAEEASRLKSEFLANTSHELRTPLNTILGFLRLILDELCKDRDEEREFIRNAYDSSGHLLSLINDVLDLATIEAGKIVLRPDEVQLDGLFAEVGILTRIQADAKRLHLNMVAPSSGDVTVYADPERLKQVLINVVGNAIKFTPEGSVTVEARPDPGKAHVVVTVWDTGVGVPVEKQWNLFEPFVQADGSTTRRFGGTGLGLSIANKLMELMDGSIGFFSAGEGKGSTVTVTVPMHPSRKRNN